MTMAMWETEPEDELSGAAAASLPTPSDTPYRTPSKSSRRSRRSATPPDVASSSPPPLPPTEKGGRGSKRSSRDVSNDDSISVLDPRRFTPTLHANLVSEILALRRDQDDKLKLIESLEVSLHSTREEQEDLQQKNLDTAKENRSLKRQLALLEGGTSSALGELARERDEAVDGLADAKKRLDAAHKKVKNQEEDSQRVHDLWAKEKDDWEDEKRKYDRKVHVAETRLKTVLEELAAAQAAEINGQQHALESETEEPTKENDGASIRTMSMTNSVRFSMMNGGKMNGHSLADELNFDTEDDQTDNDAYDGRESALSNRRYHVRNMSRDSILSKTHRRNQSTESQMRPGSVARGRFLANQAVLERLEHGIREDDENPAPKPIYIDTGIQYSPPPSPKLPPSKPSTPEPPVMRIGKTPDVETSPRGDWEIEANQRRKRVQLSRPAPNEPPNAKQLMVSSSVQTIETPLSLQRTSKTDAQDLPGPQTEPKRAPMISISTQTDITPEVLSTSSKSFYKIPVAMTIPSISIIPPTSRPTTPREHRLPQYVKDVGCQVSLLSEPVPYSSIAVQTDEIRVDTRLDKLPVHLHPSAISSRPPSPDETPLEDKHFTPVPGNLPPRNPRRLASQRNIHGEMPSSPPASPLMEEDEPTQDAYPGNNDDGPLSNQKAPMRRPHRISSLFAGFDAASSDEVDEFGDDVSDSEYRTPLSAPKPNKHKRGSAGTTSTVSEQVSWAKPNKSSNYSIPEKRSSIKPTPRASEKAPAAPSASKPGAMRKAAMIQSGIASHQGRSRSPSFPDPRNPPFPIPTRASSRKPPNSVSAPSDSGRRSPTKPGEGWHRRGTRGSVYRANSLRKVRSAVAMPRNQRNRRQGSRSPPPFSPTESTPESPSLPPLPNNDITSPRHRDFPIKYRSHKSQPSTTTANTVNTENTGLASVNSGTQASGVVDAIAQTMVGEWMFKYVRRRKSFGVSEGAGKDDSSNDRHKRWVWLAPYERAILWSSKQPSSGSALMGKSGRKLTIQSVLDVKDDNPPPKGVTAIFNRSILILTPQRALKFTATNAERHYLWLTSLSFLAHSSQAIPEITTAPAPPKIAPPGPPPDFDLENQKLKKKAGIRDSIRLAKGKSNVSLNRPDQVDSAQMDAALHFQKTSDAFVPPIPAHQRELSREAAEPPFIPRFHERSSERVHERANQVVLHGRKRSNTGGHVPPPLSFRGFSGPMSNSSYHASTNSTANASVGTAGSSDVYSQVGSGSNYSQPASHSAWGMSTAGSQRTSEASSRPGSNFFEAIGTVRMEAFISPLAFPRVEEYPDENDELRYRARRRSKEIRRRRSRSRHRESYGSRQTRTTDSYYGGSRTGGEEDYFRDDPFKGF